MTRTNRRLLAGLLALVGVLLLAEPASRLVLADAPTGPVIEDIDDAIGLGIVEPDVVEALRAGGDVVGVVVVNVDAALDALERRFPDPADRAELVLAVRDTIADAKQRLGAALGDRATLVADFAFVPSLALRFRSEEALVAAARLPLVSSIRLERLGTPTLDQSLDVINAREVQQAGHRGQGTYVAVLDTGVDVDGFRAWFPDGSVPILHRAADADGSALAHGHGTHVASTVLGVAPETRVISVDIFRWDTAPRGDPQWSDRRLLDGISYVVELKQRYLSDPTQCCNIVALNLSIGWGGKYLTDVCTDEYGLRSAYLAGIVPVVSSGNDAIDEDTRQFRPGVSIPACSGWALSVGATTDASFAESDFCDSSGGVDRVTSFSQTGTTLGVLAPGACIAAAGGAWQGTSMAAPHVAGAAAALASARTTATAEEIWTAITSAGPVIRDDRTNPSTDRRRLDVAAAAALLTGGAIPPVDPGSGTGVVRRVEIDPDELTVGTPLRPGEAFDLPVIPILNAGSQTETLRMTLAAADGAGRTPPASWVVSTPSSLTLAPGSVAFAQVRIDLPYDAPPGDYVALLGPQRTIAGLPAEDDQAASVRLSFTVEEAGNPLGGLIEWISRTIGGSMLIRGGFGGLLIVGAFRVMRARPPAPTTA